MRKGPLATAVACLLISLSLPGKAGASTVPATYQQTLYVGNYWTAAGTYNDSLQQQGDPSEEIVADVYDLTTSFSGFELTGYLPSDAEVQMEYLNNQGTMIGTANITSAQLNQEITALPTGTWGMIMHIYEPSNSAGDVWLTETWSNAYAESTSGAVLWVTPPWGYTTAPTTGLGPGWPPPPNWTQIEQEIGHDIWFEAPPIPPPPSGSSQVSAPPPITAPVLTGIPQSPPDQSLTVDFTSGYTPITVSTSGSSAFAIGDPENLPHQAPGAILVPGSAPAVGFTPVAPSLVNSSPAPSASAPPPASGPSTLFSGSYAGGGPQPAVGAPIPGTGAIPQTTPPSSASGPFPGSFTGSTYINPTPSYSGATIANVPDPIYGSP